MAASDTFVSVIAPLKDDGDIVEAFVDEVMAMLQANYTNYELVLVDDGSADDTVARVDALLKKYPCIRLLRLSRSFGTEVAIACGLDSVIGDYVAIMLPDSDPAALVPELVAKARTGKTLVYGVRAHREGEPLWSRLGAKAFYALATRLFDLRLVRDSTYFRVLSRQAVNGITRIKDKYRYLRLLSLEAGYAAEAFTYRPVQRRLQRRQRGLVESFAQAVDVTVAHSTRPLRLVSGLGLLASSLNLLYMVYVVAIYLFKSRVAEGWTTSSLQASGMFFLLFLILAVMGEYLGRTLEESRERPLYHLLEERNSNVLLADAERRNVVQESVARGA